MTSINPDGLRSAASRFDRILPGVEETPDPVEHAADNASKANDGFMLSGACEDYAERTRGTSNMLADHLEAMADLLEEAADEWAGADDEQATAFEQLLAELEGPGR